MTDQDLLTINAMGSYGDAFVRALAKAALLADPDNLTRIKEAWPELWGKYSRKVGEKEDFGQQQTNDNTIDK